MSIRQTIPALLRELRAMRDEVRASGSARGGDPLTNTCNDLAVAIMEIGGLNLSIPPQKSGKEADPEILLAEMARWRKANSSPRPKRAPDAPIVQPQRGPWRL